MDYPLPPGPVFSKFGLMLFQLLPAQAPFDFLKFAMDTARDYGDFTCARVGSLHVYQITDPELVREVLIEKADKFTKADILRTAIGPVVGNGLLTSEGDYWKRQRKLAQPAFHHKRIEAYAQTMVDQTLHLLEGWQTDQPFDVFHEMMKLTLGIVSQTLFGVDVSAEASRIGGLVTTILENANSRLNTAPNIWDRLSNAKKRQEQAATEELHALIMDIIAKRRNDKTDTGDLLSMFLMAADEENGVGMTDQQLRDEVMTLFLAGHETTANALTWTWYLLSQHPDIETKLHEELDRALGGRAPTMADLANMPYTEMVIKESMRLYPPAGGISRQPLEDVQVGDYVIPKGSIISISSYAMHHNPRYFPEPEKYMPERFSKGNEANIPRYAYLPFGGGERVCIGNIFAMMEARLALATIAQRYRLSLVAGQKVIAEQVFTIRPRNGIRMTAAVREPAAVVTAYSVGG